jgi:hypothetical protein
VEQGPALAGDLLAAAARLMGDPGLLAALSRPEPNRAVAACLDDLEAAMMKV